MKVIDTTVNLGENSLSYYLEERSRKPGRRLMRRRVADHRRSRVKDAIDCWGGNAVKRIIEEGRRERERDNGVNGSAVGSEATKTAYVRTENGDACRWSFIAALEGRSFLK